jgi:hypothetical protein
MDVGITFVYVVHDQEEALTMSDRIAVMHRAGSSRLVCREDLYDRPATSFVADFIGTTNLPSGTVERAGAEGAVVRLDSGDICGSRPRAARRDRPSSSVSGRSRSPSRGCGGHGTGNGGAVTPAAHRWPPRSSRWRTLAQLFNIGFARGGLALSVLAGRWVHGESVNPCG